ncbi:DUF1566 domain-containing protein [Pseudomonas sp. NCHU5208]|uniref:Lcl C-terminal domain-containing protein n=1 Tax=unclassified Pseudomonas TaxID=196821 RepID=UPI003F9AD341
MIFPRFLAALSLLSMATAFAQPEPSSTTLSVREGVAYDRANGLAWMRCSHGMHWQDGACQGQVELIDWTRAQQWAESLGDGWRLPAVDELDALLRSSAEGPLLDPQIFPGITDQGEGEAPYWTSSLYEGIPSMVIYLDLLSGRLDVHSPGFALGALLVRNVPGNEL